MVREGAGQVLSSVRCDKYGEGQMEEKKMAGRKCIMKFLWTFSEKTDCIIHLHMYCENACMGALGGQT